MRRYHYHYYSRAQRHQQIQYGSSTVIKNLQVDRDHLALWIIYQLTWGSFILAAWIELVGMANYSSTGHTQPHVRISLQLYGTT